MIEDLTFMMKTAVWTSSRNVRNATADSPALITLLPHRCRPGLGSMSEISHMLGSTASEVAEQTIDSLQPSNPNTVRLDGLATLDSSDDLA
jgi:hypothetical protein